ncbi:hypothetical protein ACTFIY_007122 [Dictyostelium cf. discoideum]
MNNLNHHYNNEEKTTKKTKNTEFNKLQPSSNQQTPISYSLTTNDTSLSPTNNDSSPSTKNDTSPHFTNHSTLSTTDSHSLTTYSKEGGVSSAVIEGNILLPSLTENLPMIMIMKILIYQIKYHQSQSNQSHRQQSTQSEHQNSVKKSRKRSEPKRIITLSFFKHIPGTEKYLCNNCQKKIKSNGISVANLEHHKNSCNNFGEKEIKIRTVQVYESLLNLIIDCNLPVSFVERESFKQFIETLRNLPQIIEYKLMSRGTLKSRILQQKLSTENFLKQLI